jgi:hypothetical protein
MISICCSLPKPDYQELSQEERKVFCRWVYLLRKRGYSVVVAQDMAYRKLLEDGLPFNVGKECC